MDVLTGQQLQKKDGTLVSAEDALKDKKVVAYYFSAHWCPPCRGFTPMLKDFYTDLRDDDKEIEIIFVSSDRSEDDMKAYMKEDHGEWLCIPFGSEVSKTLKQKYAIQGIPSLIVVKHNGDIITKDGRSDVSGTGPGIFDKWAQ